MTNSGGDVGNPSLPGSSTQEENPRMRMRVPGRCRGDEVEISSYLVRVFYDYTSPTRASLGRGTYALRPQRDIAHGERASCKTLTSKPGAPRADQRRLSDLVDALRLILIVLTPYSLSTFKQRHKHQL